MTDWRAAEIRRRRDRSEDFGAARRRWKIGLLGQVETGESGDIGADGATVAGHGQIRAAALRRRGNRRLQRGQRVDMAEGQNELKRDGQQGQARAKS
jgi:hypothetical protein